MTWADLATAAALGTGQRPFRPDDVPERIRDLLDPESPPAQQLLDAAAAWTVTRRAVMPVAADPDVIGEETETQPEVSDRLSTVIVRILQQRGGDRLLAETVLGIRTAGFRVPHRLIVPLLERASGPVREHLAAVIGARGRWLLANVPELVPVHDEPDADWDGPLPARRRWLEQQRASDARSARALVEASWASEPVAERQIFVTVIAETAGPDDIAFLDAAVDDRSDRVARIAVDGLRRLGFASRWRERVLEHARTIALTEDGVTFQEPVGHLVRDLGSQEVTLNTVAAVHPDAWPALAGVSAADILLAGSEDMQVVAGMAIAASTARNAALARQVLDAPGCSQLPADLLGPLCAVLDVESRFAVAVARRDDAPAVALAALTSLPQPWYDPAIRLAVDWAASLRDRLRTATPAVRRTLAPLDPVLIALLDVLQFAIPPHLARSWAERISLIPPSSPQDRCQDLRAVSAVLLLRAAVWDELRPSLRPRTIRGAG